MRYEIKRPDSADWESFTTESLASEVESGRLRAHWKIRTEWDSKTYSIEELCDLQSAATAKRQSAQASVNSERGGAKDPQGGAPRRLFYFLSFYLIATFLWRTLTAAHEYGSRTSVYLSIGFDVLCVVGLIGLRMKMSRAARMKEPTGTGRNVLFVVALIAGLGLLAIRLDSDRSWWTGHLRFELLPSR